MAVVFRGAGLALRFVLGTEKAFGIGAAIGVRGFFNKRHVTFGGDDVVVNRPGGVQHGRMLFGGNLKIGVQEYVVLFVGFVMLDIRRSIGDAVQRVQIVGGESLRAGKGQRPQQGGKQHAFH